MRAPRTKTQTSSRWSASRRSCAVNKRDNSADELERKKRGDPNSREDEDLKMKREKTSSTKSREITAYHGQMQYGAPSSSEARMEIDTSAKTKSGSRHWGGRAGDQDERRWMLKIW